MLHFVPAMRRALLQHKPNPEADHSLADEAALLERMLSGTAGQVPVDPVPVEIGPLIRSFGGGFDSICRTACCTRPPAPRTPPSAPFLTPACMCSLSQAH